MPRRRKNAEDGVGARLRLARKDAGSTLARVAKATGVGVSSLSKFENDLSTPSFGDVARLAQFYGWPLIFFATGRLKTGDDPRDLAAHLYYWGLRDLEIHSGRPLIGEARSFELLAAEASDAPEVRIVEALPGLLLRNDFNDSELLSSARRHGTLKEVGWLSQIADIISRQLDINLIRPGASRRLNRTWTAARQELTHGRTEAASSQLHELAAPAAQKLAQRWGVERRVTLDEFKARAISILES